MSVAKKRSRPPRRGMPLPRALITAFVVALVAMAVAGVVGRVGLSFALIFGLGALAVTWLVEARGLYLTVISLPLFYAVGTIGAGFINSASHLPEGASPFSKTALLTSVFPLVQHFPVLIVTVLACALLAVLRLWSDKKQAKNREAEAQMKRRAEAAADERNRSERLSVADLVERESTRVRERDREERRRLQVEERKKRRTASPDSDEREDFRRAAAESAERARGSKRRPQQNLDDNLYED